MERSTKAAAGAKGNKAQGKNAPATVAAASPYREALKSAGVNERTAQRWQELAGRADGTKARTAAALAARAEAVPYAGSAAASERTSAILAARRQSLGRHLPSGAARGVADGR